jgi:hypothetical protein
MVWPAIAAAGASVIGSKMSSDAAAASQAAANEYNVAIEEARMRNQQNLQGYGATAANELAESKREYSEGQLVPYTEAGAQAVQQQQALLGLAGPEKYNEAMSRFKESPGEAFLREQQEKAVLRNAAAVGGLRSGRTQTALQEQAFDRAQTDYGNYFNRLSGLRDTGGQAASQLASQYRGITTTPPPEYTAIDKPSGPEETKEQKLLNQYGDVGTRTVAKVFSGGGK